MHQWRNKAFPTWDRTQTVRTYTDRSETDYSSADEREQQPGTKRKFKNKRFQNPTNKRSPNPQNFPFKQWGRNVSGQDPRLSQQQGNVNIPQGLRDGYGSGSYSAMQNAQFGQMAGIQPIQTMMGTQYGNYMQGPVQRLPNYPVQQIYTPNVGQQEMQTRIVRSVEMTNQESTQSASAMIQNPSLTQPPTPVSFLGVTGIN